MILKAFYFFSGFWIYRLYCMSVCAKKRKKKRKKYKIIYDISRVGPKRNARLKAKLISMISDEAWSRQGVSQFFDYSRPLVQVQKKIAFNLPQAKVEWHPVSFISQFRWFYGEGRQVESLSSIFFLAMSTKMCLLPEKMIFLWPQNRNSSFKYFEF